MPKSSADRQIKLAADVMDQDREILRTLAGRTGNTLATSEEIDCSAALGSGQYDDQQERD
jgi:hypothetical protein